MSPAPSSPARRRLPASQAKARILDAAQKRLAEGGPEAVRLKDLAADLGISHPAILHHFGSRDGLIAALERRAMRGLRGELLSEGAPSRDVLDLVYEVLGEQGHARLLAWWQLSGRGLGEDDRDEDVRMLRVLADAFHETRVDRAAARGEQAPAAEDTTFRVRLAAVAMFGEALIGGILTESAGLDDDAAVRVRFRRWLSALLEMRAEPEDGG